MNNKHPALVPCDIVLSHGHYFLSYLIRKVTGSYWNHAGIYLGNGKVIEARKFGVVVSPFVDKGKDTLILRAKLTIEQKKNIITYAKTQKGKKYDFIHLFTLFFYFLFQIKPRASKNHFICSELVAQAFAHGGIALANKPIKLITPKDISESKALIHIV